MEHINLTTNSRKNKHLNDFERGQIQLLHNKGYSAYKIAKELYRNGYYGRDYTTKVGTLNLRFPRTRDGKFSTEICESSPKYVEKFFFKKEYFYVRIKFRVILFIYRIQEE